MVDLTETVHEALSSPLALPLHDAGDTGKDAHDVVALDVKVRHRSSPPGAAAGGPVLRPWGGCRCGQCYEVWGEESCHIDGRHGSRRQRHGLWPGGAAPRSRLVVHGQRSSGGAR